MTRCWRKAGIAFSPADTTTIALEFIQRVRKIRLFKSALPFQTLDFVNRLHNRCATKEKACGRKIFTGQDFTNQLEKQMAGTTDYQTYAGVADSLEGAVTAAHAKIPIREGRDFVICRVLEWGYQRGGFVDAKQFFAIVIEEDISELHK